MKKKFIVSMLASLMLMTTISPAYAADVGVVTKDSGGEQILDYDGETSLSHIVEGSQLTETTTEYIEEIKETNEGDSLITDEGDIEKLGLSNQIKEFEQEQGVSIIGVAPVVEGSEMERKITAREIMDGSIDLNKLEKDTTSTYLTATAGRFDTSGAFVGTMWVFKDATSPAPNANSSEGWGWSGEEGPYLSGHWGDWRISYMMGNNGQKYLVYCIAPTKPVNRSTTGYPYSKSMATFNSFPEWVRKRVWALAAFGYGYKGNTGRYRYLIAQELIWETIPLGYTDTAYSKSYPVYITWSGGNPGVPAYSAAEARPVRAEITALARGYHVPTFDKTSSTVTVGSTITFTTKGAYDNLDFYDVNLGTGLQLVSKKKNSIQVKVTGTTTAGNNITLTENRNSTMNSFKSETAGWVNANHQPLFTFGYDYLPALSVKLTAAAQLGTAKITKLQRNQITGNTAGLKGVQFEMSYYSDFRAGQTWTYTTDNNGVIQVPGWNVGTIYYREKSVPSGIVIDRTTKSMKITAGKTTAVSVTNNQTASRFVINKKNDLGAALANISFQIKNSAGTVLHTVKTNASGTVTTPLLAHGTYTITETNPPTGKTAYSRSVAVGHTNQTTAVTTKTLNIVNNSKTMFDIKIVNMKIPVVKSSAGLKVNATVAKVKNYTDTAKENSLANEIVKFVLYRKNGSSWTAVESKQYKLSQLATSNSIPLVYTVPANIAGVNSTTNFKLQVELPSYSTHSGNESESPKETPIKSSASSLEIVGYTARETAINLSNVTTLHTVKAPIETSRTYGSATVTKYEELKVQINGVPAKMRTGYGFGYPVTLTYTTELTNSSFSQTQLRDKMNLSIPSNLVDDPVLNPSKSTSGNIRVPLELTNSSTGKYELKSVDVRKWTGAILKKNDNSVMANEKVDGGRKNYVPVWAATGNRTITFKMDDIGINAFDINKTQTLNIFAQMIATVNSPTAKDDGILIIPVMTGNPFASMPLNSNGVRAPEGFTQTMLNTLLSWNSFSN